MGRIHEGGRAAPASRGRRRGPGDGHAGGLGGGRTAPLRGDPPHQAGGRSGRGGHSLLVVGFAGPPGEPPLVHHRPRGRRSRTPHDRPVARGPLAKNQVSAYPLVLPHQRLHRVALSAAHQPLAHVQAGLVEHRLLSAAFDPLVLLGRAGAAAEPDGRIPGGLCGLCGRGRGCPLIPAPTQKDSSRTHRPWIDRRVHDRVTCRPRGSACRVLGDTGRPQPPLRMGLGRRYRGGSRRTVRFRAGVQPAALLPSG